MTSPTEMFKPTEAAVVSGVSLRDINYVIDRDLLPARSVRRGQTRGLSVEGCFYTAFYFGSAKRLTAEERRFAIDTVDERVGSASSRGLWTELEARCFVEDAFLRIDLEPFLKMTHMRWSNYLAAREMVTTSPETLGGTPVIKDTRVPVYDIASSVAAGLPVDRILEAYPALGRREVELADLYATANPPQGRPPVRPLFDKATLLSENIVPRSRSTT